ncbi:facilitated trehalose transporter Tret1 [Leptinotarsa decemlineata]|uniref:facilitated trehalose transporter Tret1 n=1 Tax=Leptinotarsa decemlineata TaxID=7539 RepID=UPI003D309C2D
MTDHTKISDRQLEVLYEPINFEESRKTCDTKKRRDTGFLYFTLLSANLAMFSNGSYLVWTSPVIPQLKSNDSDINPLGEAITTGQISMLVGLPFFSGMLAPLLLGKLPDIIGRKNTLLCISAGALIAHIAVAFGRHIYVYYVGKTIIGLTFGLLFVVQPMYTNEICEKHNRAKHGCLTMFFVPLGSVYSFLLGPLTSVRSFTLLCALPLVIHLILVYSLVPESPYYTASRNRREATIQILEKLRSDKSPAEIEKDYTEIESTLGTRRTRKVLLGELFSSPLLRKGFIVGLGTCTSTYVTGVQVLMAFMAPLFNDANTNLSGNTIALLVGITKLSFYLIAAFIVGKLGRRPLLLFSSFGTGICLAIIALYFYLKQINPSLVESFRWLPILSIVFYISCYSLGVGPLPISILSELFPSDLRSTATSLASTILSIFLFIIVTLYPILSESLGVHCCLGIFSVGCFLSFTFMFLLLPETKGKSFSEIQEILSR